MPELPEVETIRRGLAKKIVGLTIKNVEVLNPKTFQGDPSVTKGLKIVKVWRRAKVLGIDLEGGLSLLFHLKMSGQIIYLNQDSKKLFAGGHPTKNMLSGMPNKSTRVVFHLSLDAKRSTLYFNDQRKFGWVKVLNTDQLETLAFLKNLGPEPLESGFTPEILQKNLSRRQKQPVKVALLDQQIISGIGNIYACEACFIAGIHPSTPVSHLKPKDYQNLHKSIIQTLESSIKYGGSTKQHYYNESGEKGYFLEVAYVYGRKGQPCRVCLTPIAKITINGRGTYLCPKCQK